jgi:hypothetical protein
MFVHKKVGYNPNAKSVPVPIIGHSNEIVIPVNLAKRMYAKLENYDPFTVPIYNRLRHLFTHTVVKKSK